MDLEKLPLPEPSRVGQPTGDHGLAEKLAVLGSEDCLQARVARGKRAKLDRVLGQVPDATPVESDGVSRES